MGQKSSNFCDTTQIDVSLKTPARLRAPSYAPRWITGGIPVGPYLALAVRSALRSPFASRPPPRSHHPGLSLGFPALVTSLRHRFEALHLLVCIIARSLRLSSGFLKKVSFFFFAYAARGTRAPLRAASVSADFCRRACAGRHCFARRRGCLKVNWRRCSARFRRARRG